MLEDIWSLFESAFALDDLSASAKQAMSHLSDFSYVETHARQQTDGRAHRLTPQSSRVTPLSRRVLSV